MSSGALGKVYETGEVIIRQGEVGNCMYVIQDGEVEVISKSDQGEVRLAVRGKGEFIGEMSLFEKEVRSAEVRAMRTTRVLTIDSRSLMARFHEDPSLAFRLVQTLSHRVRELSAEVARLKNRL